MTDSPVGGREKGGPRGGSGDIGSSDQTDGARPGKRRLLTTSRIVLLILVIVAAAATAFDLRARSQFNRTVEDFSRAWEAAEQNGAGVYRADFEKLIHGAPLIERDVETGVETFAWKGIGTYRLEVRYGSGDVVSAFKTLQAGE
jgi:hypothetical protein